MTDHTVRAASGKYTFINRHAEARIDVLRYGQPWVADLTAANAVSSLMAELDAARVVVQAARALSEAFSKMAIEILAELARCDGGAGVNLVRAIALHDRLCDDRETPSAWCGGEVATDETATEPKR